MPVPSLISRPRNKPPVRISNETLAITFQGHLDSLEAQLYLSDPTHHGTLMLDSALTTLARSKETNAAGMTTPEAQTCAPTHTHTYSVCGRCAVKSAWS